MFVNEVATILELILALSEHITSRKIADYFEFQLNLSELDPKLWAVVAYSHVTGNLHSQIWISNAGPIGYSSAHNVSHKSWFHVEISTIRAI